jgi:hypothetical protein
MAYNSTTSVRLAGQTTRELSLLHLSSNERQKRPMNENDGIVK